MTATLAAGSQHPAAIVGSHFFTKSVLIPSLATAGLISAFHSFKKIKLLWTKDCKGRKITYNRKKYPQIHLNSGDSPENA